jgi:RTX calcium-binding nonapeptide repeat (4 copies)
MRTRPHMAARARPLAPIAAVALAAAVSLAYAALALAMADHSGWPRIGHHKGHPRNESGTMRGWKRVHNELLGGAGNDTIYAGNKGDVIWGDSHAFGNPSSQRDELHGGRGNDWLYSSHGYNHIWTGAGNDHIALIYGHGIVDCNGRGLKVFVMRYLPRNRPWKLRGCRNKLILRYRA